MNSFFERLKYKFMNFMSGRYGGDEFNKFLFVVYCVLLILSIFIHSYIFSAFIWAVVFYSLYRSFSRNISERDKENAKYLIIKNKTLKAFRLRKERFGDKTHVYKKCPHCKVTLRFPRKKGKHNAVCPKCKKSMTVNVWYDVK